MRKAPPTPSIILRSALVGFLLGIVLRAFFIPDFFVLAFFLVVPVLILLFKRFSAAIVLLIVASGCFLGSVLYDARGPDSESVAFIEDGTARVEGTIVRMDASDERQQFTLDQLIIDGVRHDDKILVFAPLFPERTYGDRVVLRCNLENPEPFEGFAYDRYLAAKQIYKTCFISVAPLLVEENEGHPVKQFLWLLREGVIERIDVLFGEPHGSLLAGLLLGEQRFSERWQERFQVTGTTHIVAASGYNVTIVVFLLFSGLTFLHVKRQHAFYLLSLGVIGYVVLAGAEAAVVRAGIMAFLVLLSRQLGRRASMLNVLLIVASGMLFVNPFLLRSDVGFQLSMLSTVGLIYAVPLVEKKLLFVPKEFGIRESLSATVTATLFTLPVVFMSFGQVSFIGPIANLLVLPLIPYAMLFGSFALFLSFISTPVAVLLSGPAWALLSIVLSCIRLLSEVPFAFILIPETLHLPLALGSFLLLLYICRKIAKSSRAQLPA